MFGFLVLQSVAIAFAEYLKVVIGTVPSGKDEYKEENGDIYLMISVAGNGGEEHDESITKLEGNEDDVFMESDTLLAKPLVDGMRSVTCEPSGGGDDLSVSIHTLTIHDFRFDEVSDLPEDVEEEGNEHRFSPIRPARFSLHVTDEVVWIAPTFSVEDCRRV